MKTFLTVLFVIFLISELLLKPFDKFLFKDLEDENKGGSKDKGNSRGKAKHNKRRRPAKEKEDYEEEPPICSKCGRVHTYGEDLCGDAVVPKHGLVPEKKSRNSLDTI